MIKVDTHIHTKEFSNDANMQLNQVLSNVRENSNHLFCTVEHYDYDYLCPYTENNLIVDLEKYSTYFQINKNNYENKNNKPYPILFGIEFGYLNHLGKFYEYLSKIRNFDMIIASIHCIDGIDPYFDRSLFDKGNEFVFGKYLEKIIEMLDSTNGFDVIGHYDYISRYSPYEDKIIKYSNFSDHFDLIFQKSIQQGKALELNTKTSYKLSTKKDKFLFDVKILERYKQLGGELITIGSDSHESSSLFLLYDETVELLRKAGFKYITYYKNRNPEFIKI